MSTIRRWWQQPDQYDWTTQFLRQRGLLRSARLIMATVAGSAALVPLAFLAGLNSPHVAAVAAGLAGALFTLGMTTYWLYRWPTRRQSEIVVTFGVLVIAVWSTAQPAAAVAVLACTATAVTGGYIAFFHSTRLLFLNFAAAFVLAWTATARLAADTDFSTAVAAFWLVVFLNISVPIGVRAMSLALSEYATRSEVDPLTGLLNRRAFTGVVARRLGNGSLSVTHLTVLMVDLDAFKRINDTRGHLAGDRVLLAVAELLREHYPPPAAVCRAGGEEFLVADLGDLGRARAHASRLCLAIAALPHEVTASIGTAATSVVSGARSSVRPLLDDLISAADLAMYAAKREGGNRAHHAD